MNFESPKLNSESPEKKPEKEEKKKRESAIMEINVEDDKKESFFEYFSEVNKENKFDDKAEKEKTEAELSIIRKVNERMRGFVEHYGGRFIEVNPENIHMADQKKLSSQDWDYLKKNFDMDHTKAAYRFGSERIIFLTIRGEDEFDFAKTLVHEMLHFNSFQSLDVKWENDKRESGSFFENQVGLSLTRKHDDKDKTWKCFSKLNEALTEELTRRFVEENFNDIEELDEAKKHRRWFLGDEEADDIKLGDVSIRAVRKKKGHHVVKMKGIETYAEERKYLRYLVRDIYRRSKGKFLSEEEVFSLFCRAYFLGNNGELKDAIDGAFGEGYFDKIGYETGKDLEKNPIPFKKKEKEM